MKQNSNLSQRVTGATSSNDNSKKGDYQISRGCGGFRSGGAREFDNASEHQNQIKSNRFDIGGPPGIVPASLSSPLTSIRESTALLVKVTSLTTSMARTKAGPKPSTLPMAYTPWIMLRCLESVQFRKNGHTTQSLCDSIFLLCSLQSLLVFRQE